MSDLTKHIRHLQQKSSALEPGPAARKKLQRQVLGYTESFLKHLPKTKGYNFQPEAVEKLWQSTIDEQPNTELKALLQTLHESVDTQGINPASGGHLGYIPGGGIYTSALADYMADISNRYAGVYFAGPGAVAMEHRVVEWLAEITGYPTSGGGNLTSGGSIANLIAMVTAREAHKLHSKDYPRATVYLSQQVHHSITKALHIAGLGDCNIRFIPLDERFRMQVGALKEQIKADKQAGYYPWLVVASAGTTDVGAVDPLDDIADIAQKQGLWYHIDGAYGAFFMLCKTCRSLFKGMERSDSMVLDPHKGLFLPYGSGAVLVRDKELLYKAHAYKAGYMQDAKSDTYSPAELSPELTKHFRGLRIWLPLKLHGIAAFRSALEEKLLLTRYLYKQLQQSENFEVLLEPELSVVAFRYVPPHVRKLPIEQQNVLNRQLLKVLHADGRVFISSTLLNGKVTLRAAILSFRTHLETIDQLLDMLKEGIQTLEAQKQ